MRVAWLALFGGCAEPWLPMERTGQGDFGDVLSRLSAWALVHFDSGRGATVRTITIVITITIVLPCLAGCNRNATCEDVPGGGRLGYGARGGWRTSTAVRSQ